MATYYIGADVHTNNTQLAIEQAGQIVARYSVPTIIPAISTVLSSVQGRKILVIRTSGQQLHDSPPPQTSAQGKNVGKH